MSRPAPATAASGEIDFFYSSGDNNSQSDKNEFFHRQSSFRGIQNALSKIDPEVVKSVMNSNRSTSVPCTPRISDQSSSSPVPALPLLNKSNSAFRSSESNIPLTIFYNGRVSVFNLPVEKAEMVLKRAVQACSVDNEPKLAVSSSNQPQLIPSRNEDLPITMRKSVGVFLERRKERYHT